MDDQRRFITAMVLSAVVFMAYWFLFVLPTQEAARADAEREIARAAAENPVAEVAPPAIQPREVLVASGARIPIDAPGIRGSLLTTGFSSMTSHSMSTTRRSIRKTDKSNSSTRWAVNGPVSSQITGPCRASARIRSASTRPGPLFPVIV